MEATATPATTEMRFSRTGKRPVDIPKGVTAVLVSGKFEVKGPKGALSRVVPPNVEVKIEGSKVSVKPLVGGRDGARYQGLARALFASMTKGVADGYL